MSRLPAVLGAPLVLRQARAVGGATPRIPPPPEPWSGVTSPGVTTTATTAPPPARTLLVLGDSTAVGTGVADASLALGAQTAALLAARDRSAWAWSAVGRNGLTAAQVRAEFLPEALDAPADLVLVLVGWNDAMKLRPARAFALDVSAIIRELQARRLSRRVVVVAPPRFDRMTVMPQPLRGALGASASGLGRASARVSAQWGAIFVPGFDGLAVCEDDRFHPNAAGYAAMAAGVAAALQ